MKLIVEIQEQDVNPKAPVVDDSAFRIREAARAVCFDSEGKVPLLRVGLHSYHKLPGGGVKEGEDIQEALARELLEEIGCRAKVQTEIGKVIEHKNEFNLIQKSHCFVANIIGEKREPKFTDYEISEQFSIVWAGNIESAIDLIEKDNPTDYQGRFIKIRDTEILRTALTIQGRF